MIDFLVKLYNKFPNEKIFGVFDFRSPAIFIRDPDIVKQLTIKDFEYFQDHRLFLDKNIDDLFGNSLIMLRGCRWHEIRTILTPFFTSQKMRKIYELINNCALNMIEHLFERNGDSDDNEIKDLVSYYTNDVIATIAFGHQINSFKNKRNKFLIHSKSLFKSKSFQLKLILIPIISRVIPFILKLLNIQMFNFETRWFFEKTVLDKMASRRQECNNEKMLRVDLIDTLLKQTKINNMNDKEMVAQCFLFYVAGFDTTSTLLSFATYQLAINSHIQDTLYNEIIETNHHLNGNHVTYDELQKMKYLDQVISETLRIWPPGMYTSRECTKNYQYDDGEQKFIIDKGTAIWIPIYALHHDQNYFPEPEKFDPERFNDENKAQIRSGSYLPFCIGPRNCIGSRFAVFTAKIILFHLILNFKLIPNDKTQIPIRIQPGPGFIETEKGIYFDFLKR